VTHIYLRFYRYEHLAFSEIEVLFKTL
jgi:hypothetical protein